MSSGRTKPMITKKHHDAVAVMLRSQTIKADEKTVEIVHIIAERLAMMYAYDNPRFDEAQFLKTCGVL